MAKIIFPKNERIELIPTMTEIENERKVRCERAYETAAKEIHNHLLKEKEYFKVDVRNISNEKIEYIRNEIVMYGYNFEFEKESNTIHCYNNEYAKKLKKEKKMFNALCIILAFLMGFLIYLIYNN